MEITNVSFASGTQLLHCIDPESLNLHIHSSSLKGFWLPDSMAQDPEVPIYPSIKSIGEQLLKHYQKSNCACINDH